MVLATSRPGGLTRKNEGFVSFQRSLGATERDEDQDDHQGNRREPHPDRLQQRDTYQHNGSFHFGVCMQLA
jgi:hypothetical protein